jgi:hypothetical protein
MIHAAIMQKVMDELKPVLIDSIDPEDDTRVGYLGLGLMQGYPIEREDARISVTIHENDPDDFEKHDPHGMFFIWKDEMDYPQEFNTVTWIRRFTVRVRCYFGRSKEGLVRARQIASVVRTRVEHTLTGVSFASIEVDGETVCLPVFEMRGETGQFGYAPDEYDFYEKVRFAVKTIVPR